MKKFISISVVFVVLAFFIIYGCTKNSDLTISESADNQILFKDLSLLQDVSPNFYDNHFYLIEKLGNNAERVKIVSTIKENGIDVNSLNIKEIKKFYFNNSEITMYSIPAQNQETIIIYKYDNLYQVNIAEFYPANDGNMQFKLKTTDRNIFYSLELNAENKIGNLIIEENLKMNRFNNNVYSVQMEKIKSMNNIEQESAVDCCRHASNWSGCMDCSAAACGRSWICVAALVFAGPETLAGFAASCIGAGPNTFC
jgi:hypothetical protein